MVAVDRDARSADETCEMIAGEGGVAMACHADITSGEDRSRIVASAVERFGRIDVLVNNVGIGVGDGGPTSLSEEAWDQIFDVNLKSMWLTCKEVLPTMRAQRSGSIVNISSIAAVCSAPLLAYRTSKAGVNALTMSLAMAGARDGIRVNAVMPGLMDTPMAIESIVAASGVDRDTLRQARSDMVPLGRAMGTAWDVANAVLYLASAEAGFVTGAILPVDGGQSARVG